MLTELYRKPFKAQEVAVMSTVRRLERARTAAIIGEMGTGKTFMAMLAIAKAERPALVVTPTIDLLNQWYGELALAFGVPIGLMGGGHHDIQPITVTTYDSAFIYV